MHGVLMRKDSEQVDILSPYEYSSLPEKEPPPVTFQKSASTTPVWVWVLLGLASMLFLAGFITLIIAVTTGSKACAPRDDGDSSCSYSDEADRANLQNFLKKVQSEYYALNSHQVTWQPGIVRMDDHVRERYG